MIRLSVYLADTAQVDLVRSILPLNLNLRLVHHVSHCRFQPLTSPGIFMPCSHTSTRLGLRTTRTPTEAEDPFGGLTKP